jgi:hypothetical protein
VAVFISGAFTATRKAPAPSATKPAPALTMADISRLVQAGISEDLIIAKLRKNGKAFDPGTDDLCSRSCIGCGRAGRVPDEVGVYCNM